jgi:hypothetical protein
VPQLLRHGLTHQVRAPRRDGSGSVHHVHGKRQGAVTNCLWCGNGDELCARCKKRAAAILALRRARAKPRRDPRDWDGVTYGKDGAEPCVELVTCEHCGAKPGRLCVRQEGGVTFGTHYKRRGAYTRGLRLTRARAAGKRPITPTG